jgi:hypothetical protein
VPEEEGAPEDEEEIDLETFEAEFIRPQRGTVGVTLNTEGPVAGAQFAGLWSTPLRVDTDQAAVLPVCRMC